jgi:hypothetical protein
VAHLLGGKVAALEESGGVPPFPGALWNTARSGTTTPSGLVPYRMRCNI